MTKLCIPVLTLVFGVSFVAVAQAATPSNDMIGEVREPAVHIQAAAKNFARDFEPRAQEQRIADAGLDDETTVEDDDEPRREYPVRSRYSASDTLEYALDRARAAGFNMPGNWERRIRSRIDRW